MPRPAPARARGAGVRLALAGLLAVFGACGGETPSGVVDAGTSADAIPLTERYLPIAKSAKWVWDVTPAPPATAHYDKTSTVEEFEAVGGTKGDLKAFRVRTVGNDGETVSWQEDTGSAVIRHREQSFDLQKVMLADQIYNPRKLRLDEAPAHLVVGAKYVENYAEVETNPTTGGTTTTVKAETWVVEAVDESVTVPAGTFKCIRLKRTGADATTSTKTFWFAKGVGKVKETGNQTEELKSYSIPK